MHDPNDVFRLASKLVPYTDAAFAPPAKRAAWKAAAETLTARDAATRIVANLTRFLADTDPENEDPFLIITALRCMGEPDRLGHATLADVELFSARAAVRIDTALGVS